MKAILYMMNRLACFIVLIVAATLVLSGCSSVMRPPSATAFMSSYEKDYAVVNMSLALYGGDLDNDSVYYDNHTDQFDDHSEWVFDLTETIFWNKGFFSIGLGGQTVTPFVQLGFVSPYVGLSAWSSIYSPVNIGNYLSDNFWKDVSYGAMLMQQIPIGNELKIGLTEHFSRNGVERSLSDNVEGFMAFSFPEPHPLFYYEVGGGFFVSYHLEKTTIALEFRYGRDLDNKQNRFAVTLGCYFGCFWCEGEKESAGENAGKRATDKIEKRKGRIGGKAEGERVAIPRRI